MTLWANAFRRISVFWYPQATAATVAPSRRLLRLNALSAWTRRAYTGDREAVAYELLSRYPGSWQTGAR